MITNVKFSFLLPQIHDGATGRKNRKGINHKKNDYRCTEVAKHQVACDCSADYSMSIEICAGTKFREIFKIANLAPANNGNNEVWYEDCMIAHVLCMCTCRWMDSYL